ncbi:MAG TPA: phosphotransferase [Coriobacteriia bacterium]
MSRDDSFRKTGPARDIAVEAAKTVAGRAIGRETGLFCVPEVVEGSRPGELLLERMDGLTTLCNAIEMHAEGLPSLFMQMGRGIAAVHRDLVLAEDMRIPFPGPWDPASVAVPVFVHGDLTAHNVCVQETTGRLVILDWSVAPHLGVQATYGSPYFDIALLFAHCSYAPPSRCGRIPLAGLFDAFLAGYAYERPGALLPDAFSEAMHAIEPEYLRLVERAAQSRGPGRRQVFQVVHGARLRAWRSYRPPRSVFESTPERSSR